MAGHYIPGWGELDDALVVVPEVARMNIQRFVQNDTVGLRIDQELERPRPWKA